MGGFDEKRAGTGTREWSEISLNLGFGCTHKCLYCYAVISALRFGLIKDRSEWGTERINEKILTRKFGRRSGIFMFPTRHDITPHLLAPSPSERIEALAFARVAGFEPSVSMEPMLEGAAGALRVVSAVQPYVSETIWIGKLNKPYQRVDVTDSVNLDAVETVVALQSDHDILSLVEAVGDNPIVRWKDSIKRVLSAHSGGSPSVG